MEIRERHTATRSTLKSMNGIIHSRCPRMEMLLHTLVWRGDIEALYREDGEALKYQE